MTVAELTIPNGWDEITPAWMYRASVAHGLAIWIAALSAWQRPEICLAFAQRHAAAFVDLDTRAALDSITA
jgi:hypothetical protein